MDPQLYRAAKVGDVTLLRQVVTGDSSRLLRVTPKGNTALHVSVSFGHIDFIQEVYAALLEHNTSLEGDTDYGRRLSLLTQVNLVGDTALHVAIREGHTSIAKFLIEKILPWPFADHDVENGNSSLAREMIRMRNKSKNTALHEALRRYDLEMVELLIEADPHDLGHPNYDADAEGGESPLYLAARDGRLDIVNKILDICPSAAHSGPHGRTALHVAIVEVHLDVVEVLLVKKGELADKIDENGRTALHYAVSLERSHRIVQQLLSHDTSSVYKVDKDGLSALHIAALNSSIEVFRELIECCPDFGELQDTNRRNVLHYAVMSKDLDKIKFALEQLEREEFINQPDEDGNTPFHLLAEQGSIKLMEPFISNVRVDTMATNKNGQTVDEIFLNTIPIIEGLSSFIKALHMQRFFNQLALKTSFMPPSSIRGEEKWIIRVTNEKRIHTNLDKQAEEVAAAAAATPPPKSVEKNKVTTLQIIASLIATVTFAAVFQVPGGYNSTDGTPVLLHNAFFRVFLVCDAVAMGSSVTSLILMLIAPGGSKYFSFLLKLAIFFLWQALFSASIAFLAGLRAVLLPRTVGFFYYSYKDPTSAAFSMMQYSVIVSFGYYPLWALVFLGLPKLLRKLLVKLYGLLTKP